MGKSTLARWLSERAREVGAATAMVATHAHPAGRHDGLRGMLDRHLGCVGLRRAAVTRRMHRLLLSEGIDDAGLADAMAELIRPAAATERGFRRFADPTERYDTLLALLRVLTARRPLVLLMLDVQWGLGLLPLLRDLLARQAGQPVPVYVVLTLDDAALQADPRLREEVEALVHRPEVESISLPPMRGAAWAPFADTLNLHPELSAKLARTTNGNPLFAQQLVADWVQQGVLSAGPKGFELAASGGQLLPSDLATLWRQRLERLLQGLSDSDAEALELAAALGKEVDEAEWLDACLRADCEPSSELTNRLFAQRLARPGAEGWRFEHHALRAALVARADRSRRWEVHNRICADLLADEGAPLRRAMHLIEAGDAREALPALADAIERARRGVDYILAHRLLEDRRRALEDVSRDLSAWGEQSVLEQLVADSERTSTGPLFNAPALLGRAVASGWTRLVPRLERVWGEQLLLSEDVEEAKAVLLDAALRARMLEDPAMEGRCLATLAAGLPPAEAGPYWLRAHLLFDAGHELQGAAQALEGVCSHAVSDGRLDEALRLAPKLRRAGNEAGYPRLEAYGWIHEGDARRKQGDATEALACYRQAQRLWPGGWTCPRTARGWPCLSSPGTTTPVSASSAVCPPRTRTRSSRRPCTSGCCPVSRSPGPGTRSTRPSARASACCGRPAL